MAEIGDSSPTPLNRRARALRWVEQGRRPTLLSIGLSAALGLFTAVRFVVLVGLLPPAEYGRLNVFLTMLNVVPPLTSIGVAWQYQRLARERGTEALRPLARAGEILILLTALPCLLGIALVGSPFAGSNDLLVLAASTWCVSAATGLVSLYSQLVLGVGFRALSALMLFLVNLGMVAALIPAVFAHEATTATVLVGWAGFALVAWAWARRAVQRRGSPQTRARVQPALREGVWTLPALVGPWLLPFAVRYALGLTLGPEDLAAFAISSTVADLAFVVAAPVITMHSNTIMDGASPMRAFVLAAPVLVVASSLGSLLLVYGLDRVAQEGYRFSVTVVVILTLSGVVRLHIGAWRVRGVAQRRVARSSWVYIPAALVLPLGLFVFRPDSDTWFAVALLAGFLAVAAWQWWTVRSPNSGAGTPEGTLTI